MAGTGQFHFVIMTAERGGAANRLAAAAGVSHKCLVPVAGKPLIEHTLRAVVESPEAARITISVENTHILKKVPFVQELLNAGRISIALSRRNMYDSVANALPTDQDFPAIVTTADNVLLTPEMIAYFCSRVGDSEASIALVRKEVLLAKHPDGQRRFHRFRDGEFSNCNLYALVRPNALAAAEMFKGGGQFAKSLKRVFNAFGLINMIAYRFALLPHDKAIARIGRRFGTELGVVEMPFPEAAIDVDNERTRKIADRILRNEVTSPTGQSQPITELLIQSEAI